MSYQNKTKRIATLFIALYAGDTGARGQFHLKIGTLALVLLAPVAQAASICRWVDESGQTHLSDVCRKVAQRTKLLRDQPN